MIRQQMSTRWFLPMHLQEVVLICLKGPQVAYISLRRHWCNYDITIFVRLLHLLHTLGVHATRFNSWQLDSTAADQSSWWPYKHRLLELMRLHPGPSGAECIDFQTHHAFTCVKILRICWRLCMQSWDVQRRIAQILSQYHETKIVGVVSLTTKYHNKNIKTDSWTQNP